MFDALRAVAWPPLAVQVHGRFRFRPHYSTMLTAGILVATSSRQQC